jgi:nucleoside phosphorylase
MSRAVQPSALRPLQFQAYDGLGEPIGKVNFYIYLDGKPKYTVTKNTEKSASFSFKYTGEEVEVVAILEGHKPIRKRIAPDLTMCEFTFQGGGQPLVLIVCALAKEAAAVQATCDRVDKSVSGPKGDNAIYSIGYYCSGKGLVPRKVLIARSGMGNTNAAALTMNALRSFNRIKHVLMVGIAGGCPNHADPEEHVRLGDIVVADQRGIVEYDSVKLTEEKVVYRAHPQRPSFAMMQAATNLDEGIELDQRPWEQWIRIGQTKIKSAKRPNTATDVLKIEGETVCHPKDPLRRRGWPKIHRGAIATSNALLKNPKIRDDIRDRWGVRAVEMEGSGVQGAAWIEGLDVMVVRGICDYCDKHKNNTWQAYAALAAAAYVRALIEALPDDWFP